MIVLSYGITKSGSTLAFELCKALLLECGYQQRRLPEGIVTAAESVNYIDYITVDWLKRVTAEVGENEIIVIKFHTDLRPAERAFVERAVRERRMRLHVVFRDPREIALSLLDAGAAARKNNWQAFSQYITLSDAAKEVNNQLRKCRRWGSVAGALHLYYNDVAFDAVAVVNRMGADLGFAPLNLEAVEQLINRVFNAAFTQKNKAVRDRYKAELTNEQNQTLLDEIEHCRDFVLRACERRDYRWFSDPSPA